MKVPAVPIYSELASKYKKNIFTFPMAHNRHAEIIFDDKSMSAFVVEQNKKLIFARGFAGAKNSFDFAANMTAISAHLNRLGADMAELAVAFQDACGSILRNVK